MAKGNPNPTHRFSSTNQPKNRRRSQKALTTMLRKKLKQAPDGGKKFIEELVDLILNELRNVRDGKTEFTSVHAKLIDMVWDRFEGPVTQEVDVELTGGGVVLVPGDMDSALQKRKDKPQETEPEDEDDE